MDLFYFDAYTILCTAPTLMYGELFEHGNVKRYSNLSKQTLVVTGLAPVEMFPGHPFPWDLGMLVLIKFPFPS